MSKRIVTMIVAAGLLASSAAYAGAKWGYQVYVSPNSDGSGSFVGTLGSTRNTADSTSQMGCYYENLPAPWGYKYASCYAYDGTHSASCGTTDPQQTDTISRLQGDAYLWVQYDASGNCTRVQIGSQSWAAPKGP
jgi:hypothetical protein